MRKLLTLLLGVLLAWPALADMYQDASNAKNPEAMTKLLSGGALVGGTLTYPNQPRSRIFGFGASHGTTTGAGITSAYTFNVDADDVDSSSTTGSYNTYIGSSVGGATLKGHRNGMGAVLNLTAPTGNVPPFDAFYTALSAFTTALSPDNGTAGVPLGNIFAANFGTRLGPTATNMNSLVGLEIDIDAEAGSSVAYKHGLTIVQGNADRVRGSVQDIAFAMGNGGAAPGWSYGISFGTRAGAWPLAPTGTIIGTNPSTIYPGVLYTTANGVDFRQVTFSDSAFASPGFSVTGTGSARTTALSVEDTRGLAAGIGGAIALKAVNGAGAQVPYGAIHSSAVGGVVGGESGDLILQTMMSGALTDVGRFDSIGGFAVKRGIMSGSLTPLALVPGEVGMVRVASGAGAPGAAGGKLAFLCGTNAGTAKLVAYAGTSATPVTVIDNIGAGVAGC